jgi:hypothetical protein
MGRQGQVVGKEIWPNFFIVGARKAGTSSLYKYLTQIPGVYMSPNKEPHYFSSDYHPASSVTPVIRQKEEYLKLFERATCHTAIGEASTSYLFAEGTPKRIKDKVNNARIIIILRNPIDRAFSHYLMNVSAGFQNKTFLDALISDYNKEIKALGVAFLYIELGMYYEQIRRYFQTFDREMIKVIIFEEFIQRTQPILVEILEFLGLPPDIPSNINNVYNRFFLPGSPISRIIYNNKFANKISARIPESRLKSKVKRIVLGKSLQKPSMSEEARRFLAKFYEEDVEKLKGLLGRDLQWKL